jgi:multicomponent Na+:H+ antiporter subunit C
VEVVLAIVVGGLYAAGLYLVMRRNVFKLVLGVALMGHAANLFLFTMGRLKQGFPPLISKGGSHLDNLIADPVPQALILTAIVIGFGVQAFATVLIRCCYEILGTDDLNRMKSTDQP